MPPIDGAALRHAMRNVPSPVTVVTAAAAGHPARGITIGSFTSVSLDPPLVCFNVQRSSPMHALLEAAPHFAVQVLSDTQAHLSDHFAQPNLDGFDQFADLPHTIGPHGLPLLEGTLVTFHCRPYAVHPAGDHSLFLGEVFQIDDQPSSETDGLVRDDDAAALLYHNRAYRTVGPVVPTATIVPSDD